MSSGDGRRSTSQHVTSETIFTVRDLAAFPRGRAVVRTTLPAERFPGLLGHDLTGSLYEVLGRKYGVELSRADSRIAAVAPSDGDAELLDISPVTPCLRVQARGLDADTHTIEATLSLYRGDLYELNVGFV